MGLLNKAMALEAIMTPPELDQFCQEFGLRIGDLEPDFTGWSKHVIKSPDLVFLFPRHPRYEEWLSTELGVYGLFEDHEKLPVPKLVRCVEDARLSHYGFGVVTRLHGELFGAIEQGLKPNQYEQVLSQLGRLAGIWHSVELDSATSFLGPLKHCLDGDHAESYKWMNRALDRNSLGEAIESAASLVNAEAMSLSIDTFGSLLNDRNLKRWESAFTDLASLDDVLLHGDIHEDQILVRSESELEISGILDWGTASVGNPVHEFNFGEWSGDIFRYRDHFRSFRDTIWSEYLDERHLPGPPAGTVHLFYTLQEFYWTTTKGEAIGFEGPLYESEIRRILGAISETTESL